MTLQEYKKQKMQNPDFSAAYDEIQPEMDIIRAIIDARISQNMTQKELSERTGINQTEISRLENGSRNPSHQTASAPCRRNGNDFKNFFCS